MCVQGARWVQLNILDKYSEDEFEVYAVWMPMLPSDARDTWKEKLLSDDRVHHYWNENRSVGRWFTKNASDCKSLGSVAWDAYYVFSDDAELGEPLASVSGCGTTIIGESDGLAEAMAKILAKE